MDDAELVLQSLKLLCRVRLANQPTSNFDKVTVLWGTLLSEYPLTLDGV